VTYTSFNPSYQGDPPWEISRPQPAVVALAEEGHFVGRVLDIGCGTGENALHLASRGHTVLGIDGAAIAIERAQAKAKRRGLPAEFVVADAFDLTALGQRFDTVLDSAFLHIPANTAARRRAYTDQLAAVLPAGGWVHLLEISEQVTEHPSITQAEIIDAFDGRWTAPRIRPATYTITTGEVPAWLASVQRR
jgi:ubiquinone/menaquinone biosynthesis C-methylase UbiE